MDETEAPGTIFTVYRTGLQDVKPIEILAATPLDAALSLDSGDGDIVVVSPNGIESRFGYRAKARLEHLDD